MISKRAKLFCNLRISRKQHAAITITTQRFSGKERGSRKITETAAIAPQTGSTQRLGCILDKFQSMLYRQFLYLFVRCRMAVEVNRNNGFSRSGNRGFQEGWIKIVGMLFNINKNRPRPGQNNGLSRSYKGKGGGNYFITGTNSQNHQSQL